MNENNILYGSSILLLLLILATFKFNKSFILLHLIIYLLYSVYFYYGLFFKIHAGTALAYWFYLIIITGLHLLFMVGYLIIKLNNKSHKNKPK